ncbi:nucleoside-diphosphate kinase, partial [Acinetobacter baumannii]|uniref:nucleoside-diphosphate kinase n=1 Tax=Acinetobacter baumannii TaxID=470 RepID=UPI002B1BDB25
DFAVSIDENAAHGSDSVASAEREIALFNTKNAQGKSHIRLMIKTAKVTGV